MRALVVVALCLWAPICSAEANLGSAGYMLPICKEALIYKPKPTATIAWEQGICIGMLRMLMYVGDALDEDSRFCCPKDASPDRAMQVIIAYIEARPRLLHHDFMAVAVDGLRDAWPCKK